MRLEVRAGTEQEASSMAKCLNRDVAVLKDAFIDCAKEQGWAPHSKGNVAIALMGSAMEGTVGVCHGSSNEELTSLVGSMMEDIEAAGDETLKRSRRHLLFVILLCLGGFMALNAPQYKMVTAFWSWISGFMVAVQMQLWLFHTTSDQRAFRQIAAEMHVFLRNLPKAERL